MIRVEIPGAPAVQGRPRATSRGRFAAVYEDAKSKSAKAYARDAIVRELERLGMPVPAYPSQLLAVRIACDFPLPKSAARKGKKSKPVPREWMRGARGDCDNLAKLYLDAGNTVLYADDSQVVLLIVERWRAGQGEHPKTVIEVCEVDAEVL
jgi:Holliday junction resolvase RusA-like endonuclease